MAQSLRIRFGMAEGPSLPEIPVVTPRAEKGLPRLNLLLPTLEPEHRFGGIATALRLFRAMASEAPEARIVVTGMPRTRRTVMPDCNGDVHFLLDEEGRLGVRSDDRFVVTTWGSAHAGFGIRAWQEVKYGAARRPVIYIIQDYEPAFHPWSSRWMLAEETYREPDTLAVFNTRDLRHYFRQNGYGFASEEVFEPRMHPELRQRRDAAMRRKRPKEKAILVYGRPSTPRNAFALMVAALRLWARSHPDAESWRIESAGEFHGPVRLARGSTLRSLGKLSLSDYANRLERAGVGVSLMASPHPSYPPLEMANFGIRTVTNRFAGREPAERHPNLDAPARNTPAELAAAIARQCEQVESDPTGGWTPDPDVNPYLAEDSDPAWCQDLVRAAFEG